METNYKFIFFNFAKKLTNNNNGTLIEHYVFYSN